MFVLGDEVSVSFIGILVFFIGMFVSLMGIPVFLNGIFVSLIGVLLFLNGIFVSSIGMNTRVLEWNVCVLIRVLVLLIGMFAPLT